MFYLPAILFLIISIYFGIDYPFIWPDEVLFFNPSEELYKNGIMRTTVLTGLIPDMENHTLWMTPLYMILYSKLFYLFPIELLTLRLGSTFFGVCSIFLINIILKNLNFSKKNIFLILLLISTDFIFLKYSHTSRMESLCLFFGLVSIYFSTKDEIVSKFDSFFVGFFLSCSFLSHPFGIIYSIPIFYLFFKKNKLQYLFNLFLGGIIPFLCWGFYIIPNLENFLIQFGAQLSRKNELLLKFTLIDKIKIIFSGFQRPIFKIILFVLVLIIIFLKKKESILQFVTIWMFSILGILFVSSESWYVFHLVIPLAILFGYSLETKLFKSIYVLNLIYNISFLTFFIYNYFYKFDVPEKINLFYEKLGIAVESKKNIYLQAVPDPYFYFRKKFPDKKLLEFIPGELVPTFEKIDFKNNKNLSLFKKSYKLNPEFYKNTATSQDVYILYNEDLLNPVIQSYLKQNQRLFQKKFVQVSIPYQFGVKLEAVIYIRR